MWCPKLSLWYIEAYKEKHIHPTTIDESYAIFPKRLYERLPLKPEKLYDFCFIGSLYTDDYANPRILPRREWILPFIKENFQDKSYLQFTDKEAKKRHTVLGKFDYTLIRTGFVPKEVLNIKDRNVYDERYYTNMCKSKFCLCPGGDKKWSMRFYEALMCKTIPIVHEKNNFHRSKAESKLGYKYYLSSDKHFVYRGDWVEHNYKLFLQHHTLDSHTVA